VDVTKNKGSGKMKRPRLCAMLTLSGLLAFASTAAAECAWVRWAEVKTEDGRPVEWKIMEVHADRDVSERELTGKGVETFKQTYWWFQCIPDTIDLRGPKGQ
jgi:hypothetical protein